MECCLCAEPQWMGVLCIPHGCCAGAMGITSSSAFCEHVLQVPEQGRGSRRSWTGGSVSGGSQVGQGMLSHGAASVANTLQPKRRPFMSHSPPLSHHFLGLSLLFHSWHQQSSDALNLSLGRTWTRMVGRLCRMVVRWPAQASCSS